MARFLSPRLGTRSHRPRVSQLVREVPIRFRLLIAAATAALIIVPSSAGASVRQLHLREHRQVRSLWARSHTLVFFRRHPWLARTKPGRRALRVAHIWIPILRRELRETRAALHPKPRTPSVDSCLSQLISRESGWDVHARNPYSGAYGLPQALPGSKMASAGSDWATNPATQIRWMLGYVRHYGGSCGALAFQKRNGWY